MVGAKLLLEEKAEALAWHGGEDVRSPLVSQPASLTGLMGPWAVG